MKISNKTNFLISSFIILILTVLYLLLIFAGIKGSNINLNKTDIISGVVEDRGIDLHHDHKHRSTKVFFIKIKGKDKKFGVYHTFRNYENLLNNINIGDSVKVYYYDNNNLTENVNIDIVVIEKNKKIILHKSEYEQKQIGLIALGFLGFIFNLVIFYRSWKKYKTTTSQL